MQKSTTNGRREFETISSKILDKTGSTGRTPVSGRPDVNSSEYQSSAKKSKAILAVCK